MSLLPRTFIGPNDDWIERLRRYWWPKLEAVWPYSTITIQDDEYVCTIDIPEQALETELESVEFVRNPVAGLKQHQDGKRTSEGSWCLLPENDPTGRLEPDEQLHVTLFRTLKGVWGTRELFAHVETDWRDDPYGHLTDGTNLQRGHDILLEVLREHSYLDMTNISNG